MKKILCYGDSNTFGFNPKNGGRYDKTTRWSGILSDLLKEKYEVIEEGMNNRTGFFKNPEGLKQSGGEYLSIYLQNHKDIDICILNLGTNDAQIFYPLNNETTQKGLQNLTSAIKNINPRTKIIIIPPVKITQDLLHSGFAVIFNKNSIDFDFETSFDLNSFIGTNTDYKSLITSVLPYDEFKGYNLNAMKHPSSYIDALYILRENAEYPPHLLSSEYMDAELNSGYFREILESVEISIKYSGYIERERKLAEKIMRLESLSIPDDFDFDKVHSLSIECRQKLKKYAPKTIAQASRISGVSPADISVLLVYFGR